MMETQTDVIMTAVVEDLKDIRRRAEHVTRKIDGKQTMREPLV